MGFDEMHHMLEQNSARVLPLREIVGSRGGQKKAETRDRDPRLVSRSRKFRSALGDYIVA